MRFKDSWTAAWEGGILHISGTTDLFPNDFSVATLERSPEAAPAGIVSYRIVFNRDKEPYCDKDRVGPVHYFESRLPPRARRVRIEAGDGERVEIEIPRRPIFSGRL
jgi:hypothetical protein